MANPDVVLELKARIAELEKELKDRNVEVENLETEVAELSERPDFDDVTTGEQFETVLEKIHYTTPGLRQVLTAGGVHPNEINELLGLLDLPVE